MTRFDRWTGLLALVLNGATLTFLLLGCAPATRFRRAALVPMPTGDNLTQPQEGIVDVSGSVTHQDVQQESVPDVGDPALRAARTSFSGSARVRLGRYIRVGAQGFYSHASLAEATATGTPPMEGQHLYGVGPNVSFNYRAPKWAVGGGLALTITSIPWATWERTDGGTSTEFEPGEDFNDRYRFQDGGRDTSFLIQFAAGATYIPSPYVQIFGGFSIQNSVYNIGFDDQPRDGSTLSADAVGVVPFVGVTGRLPIGAYARAQYFWPIAFSQFNGDALNVGGFMFTVGWDIGADDAEKR